ncbi:MAG: PAS domain S-box protein [Desulfotignum sp.]|nr:PAS domain S-box protein [Desulfotignum sp.]
MRDKPTYQELTRKIQELEKIQLNFSTRQDLFSELAADLGHALSKLKTDVQAAHHLDQIVTSLPQPISLVSDDYRYLAVNDVYAELFGTAAKNIIGKTPAHFFGEQVFENEIKPHLDHVLGGKELQYEIQADFPGRGKRWMSMSYYPYRNKQGNIAGVISHGHDITERKRAETALLISEERYRHVAEANTGIVWEMDADLYVTHFSGRVYEMLGYMPEEIIGQNPLFLIDPGDRERISAIMSRMAHTLEPVKEMESWYRHSDGRRVRMVTNSIAFFDQGGGLLGFRGTHIDITETFWARRCQEITLQLHEMINDSDDAISAFLCEACSEVTDSPMAFFGMLEPDESAMIAHVWSPEAMQECRISDKPLHFPIETAGLWAQPIRQREPVIYNDYQSTFEKQGLPEGHVPIMRYLGVPILHGDTVVAMVGAANRLPGYEERHINRLQVIASSIADLLLLRRKEEALRESEEKHRRLFETMAQGVIYQAADGAIISANSAAERILGLSFEQMQGKTSMDFRWEMILEDGTTVPGTEHPAMIALRTGETVGPVIRGVFHPEKNAHVWLYITAIPLFQPGETKPFQAYATFEDITGQKQAEKALKLAHERILTILDSIDSTVYVADMDTCEILFMNKRMITDFGGDKTGDICFQAFRKNSEPCEFCTNDQLVDKHGNPAGVRVWDDKNPITGRYYINYDRAIEWTDGRLVRMQIATDITDLKKMEAQLHQSQKMESIGSLAGGIAHDFNNLLFPIVGLSEMMLDDFPPGSPEHHDAQ